MQRRAAAIYAALFLVVGAASYSLIATATQPTVDFENPDHTLSAEDSFEVDGQEYTVREISAEVSGGGHGGGGELARSAVIARTNESGQYTETWANGSTVSFDGTEWHVIVPNESDPGEFTLREEIDETAILENDSDADNETVIHNGTRMVVVERDVDGAGHVLRLVSVAAQYVDDDRGPVALLGVLQFVGGDCGERIRHGTVRV